MKLGFTGGVKTEKKPLAANKKIIVLNEIPTVILRLGKAGEYKLNCESGSTVRKNEPVSRNKDGFAVFSPVSGVLKGVYRTDGQDYAAIVNDYKGELFSPPTPETRLLNTLTKNDIVKAAFELGIIETGSGLPLYKLLENGEYKRIVVDCCDCDCCASVAYRLCLEYPSELVGGAKILMQALSVGKSILAIESYKKKAQNSLYSEINDRSIIAVAELENKYPIDDRALIDALYAKKLERGRTAADCGVLVVSAETAIALYLCMSKGTPFVFRFIGVYGSALPEPKNLCIPTGCTVKGLLTYCGADENACLAENSTLSGMPPKATIGENVRAIAAEKEIKRIPRECNACGRCVEVCPAQLLPFELFNPANKHYAETIFKECLLCGCCEYICPSDIPLKNIIEHEKKKRVLER